MLRPKIYAHSFSFVMFCSYLVLFHFTHICRNIYLELEYMVVPAAMKQPFGILLYESYDYTKTLLYNHNFTVCIFMVSIVTGSLLITLKVGWVYMTPIATQYTREVTRLQWYCKIEDFGVYYILQYPVICNRPE